MDRLERCLDGLFSSLLRGAAVCLPCAGGSPRVSFGSGKREPRQEEKACKATKCERMRNTHAVFFGEPVIRASDWSGDDAREPMDVTGLGMQVGDTTDTGRVLPTPRTSTRAEREERDVSHVPFFPLVSVLCHGEGVGEKTPDTDWRP